MTDTFIPYPRPWLKSTVAPRENAESWSTIAASIRSRLRTRVPPCLSASGPTRRTTTVCRRCGDGHQYLDIDALSRPGGVELAERGARFADVGDRECELPVPDFLPYARRRHRQKASGSSHRHPRSPRFRAAQSRPPLPRMTVTQASLDALATHTRKRRDAVRARIEKGLKDMRREHAQITISSVSRRAKVTRKSIHPPRRPGVALIRAHRPLAVVDADTAAPAAGPETSITAALRTRLTAKDAQIAELKAALRDRDHTIAVLHGQLDKLHGTT